MINSTHWHFYIRTEDAWRAMKEACLNARKTINLEQFIFEDDPIGREFAKVLEEKSRSGVKVRILCDMVGSFSFFGSDLSERLRRAGIEIRFWNVIKPWRLHNFSSWFFRDHRKIMVVDSSIGFIGGVGIRDTMRNWRDTHLKVLGKIVEEMLGAFEEMWDAAEARNLIRRLKKTRRFLRGFYFVTNSPLFRKRFLYREYIEGMRNAKRYIYLTTPYFAPDRRFLRVLRLAVRRGVEVKILLPERTEFNWFDRASQSHYSKLLSSGIQLFHYQGEMLHAKTAVIDDIWATVGSFNLDNLSFYFDYEANIVSTSSQFAAEVKKYFVEDLRVAKEVYLGDWLGRPILNKLLEIISRFYRRFL